MPVKRADRIVVDSNTKFNNVEEYIEGVVADTVKKLVDELERLDKDQPGVLAQSIGENSFVTSSGSKLTFQLGMEDYWKFVDAGVDGTQNKHGSKYKFKNDGKPANIGAILDFIKSRGIGKFKPKKIKLKNKTIRKAVKQLSVEKQRKSIAFAMGKSIKKKGIKPTHFYSGIVNEDFKMKLKKGLVEYLKRDVEVVFQELKKELE